MEPTKPILKRREWITAQDHLTDPEAFRERQRERIRQAQQPAPANVQPIDSKIIRSKPNA